MYRDFAVRKARVRHLVGYVQNLSDGTVCVVAEGERTDLEQYVHALERGPLFAEVTNVSVDWHDATSAYDSFDIRGD